MVRPAMTAGPATTGAHKFGTVRTVLGDVPMERLGRCDYHEHLFQASPLLVGDELDDEQASRQEAESLRRAGIDAFVDATPTGLGRNPGSVARISQSAGHCRSARQRGSSSRSLRVDTLAPRGPRERPARSLPRRRPGRTARFAQATARGDGARATSYDVDLQEALTGKPLMGRP
jgi:hypothetical protein